MPPNVQQEQVPVSFIDHFWSKDKSGMDKLLSYIQTTHQDLEMIHSIYVERSAMEQEFGQRLLALSKDQASQKDDKAQGVLAAYYAVSMELKQTATTHLELSDRLKHQVATECQNKLTEYRELLSKWTTVLEELYQDRKEKTMELLKIRAKYLKEHDTAKGQSTPTMEALKNQYKTMVIKVDEVAQEWNSTWREACEVLEAMEEDRVEFLKNNVWEYANLASATLLVQDECCEDIRKQLEVCHVEQEIERCIALHATGSKIPTTNEYVGELMREQKKKHQAERAASAASENAPKPPSKPPRQQGTPPVQQQKQASKPMERNRDVQQQQQQQQERENVVYSAGPQEQRGPTTRNDTDSQQQEQHHQYQQHSRQEPQLQQRQEQQKQQQPESLQQKPAETPAPAVVPVMSTHDTAMDSTFNPKAAPYGNQFRGANVSNNMGSTATRGQIKRKPLNKSLMEQVSSEMAIARQQRVMEQQQQQNVPHASIRGGNGEEANSSTYKAAKAAEADDGSLDILLKSFEGSNSSSTAHASSATQEDHPNAVVSDEAKYRRQPSEYKPDAGSIPSRRFASNKNPNHHVLQQVVDTPSATVAASCLHSSTPEPLSHPVAAVAAPKSPRPPAQQITRDAHQQQHQEGYHYNNNAPLSMYAQPQSTAVQQQPSPHMMQQALPEQTTAGYAPQPNSAYMGHHTYQQQQQQHYMGAPQNMAQAPIMQQQRSPMMQPQRSPMMQPLHSPMMQPMHSPMMQPMHSPMMQQRGTLPPPITIPTTTTTTTNFAVTPQPSPSMSYSHLGGVSPGGILPPPTQQYAAIPPRPLQYTDGRPIQFWARAKYDYDAKDADELSFKANNLMGILEADMTQQSWWVGAIYDEYRQTWSLAASIPSNFMNSGA